MTESTKVIFQFNVSKLDVLNELYNAINRVREQHSGVEITITSKQGETRTVPIESTVVIAAKALHISNDNAKEVINAVSAINDILPDSNMC